ncbi:MAG: ATP-binding protein [Elusimicrobiota bacterium]
MPSASSQALEGLVEIGRLLSSTLDIEDLLRAILREASRVVESESASLLLLDEASGDLYFDVAMGLGEAASRMRLKPGQGIAGCVAQTRKSEIINDASADPRWSSAMDESSGFLTKSILAAPITARGRLLGVLEAINKRAGSFSAQDKICFEAFAGQAGTALENARLFSSLKEEKFKLDMIFSKMADAVILSETQGRILLANPAARQLLGINDKTISLEQAWSGFVLSPHPGSAPNAVEATSFLATRESPKPLILAGTASGFNLAQAGSKPSQEKARLWIFRDETLERSKDKLKRTFLSLISHKLRTPLTAVIGYAEILLQDFKTDQSDTKNRKALEAIAAQGKKLADLIDRLIRYATLESPEDAPLESTAFAVDEAARAAISDLADLIQSRGAIATFSKPDRPLLIFGSRDQIVEAVKNLIENAVKFNDSGENRVGIRIQSNESETSIEISDNGPGIPPEDQEKIFSQFHQVEASFTGQIDGWGLGLPFVKKVAQINRGRVELESLLGKGSRVRLVFPSYKGSGQS